MPELRVRFDHEMRREGIRIPRTSVVAHVPPPSPQFDEPHQVPRRPVPDQQNIGETAAQVRRARVAQGLDHVAVQREEHAIKNGPPEKGSCHQGQHESAEGPPHHRLGVHRHAHDQHRRDAGVHESMVEGEHVCFVFRTVLVHCQ